MEITHIHKTGYRSSGQLERSVRQSLSRREHSECSTQCLIVEGQLIIAMRIEDAVIAAGLAVCWADAHHFTYVVGALNPKYADREKTIAERRSELTASSAHNSGP